MPPLLEVDGVSKSFGDRTIFKNLTTRIIRGDRLAIVGPNGAGKTTLFEVLSGRARPSQGRVLLDGRDVTALPLHARARLGIGRTYQSPVVPEALTVGEVLKAARQAYFPMLTRHHAEWAARQVNLRVPLEAPAGAH